MMDQVQMDKIVERVRKLLALSGNNPNENEAALAAEKAQAILVEHNLSMADITNSHVADDMVIDNELVTDSYPWRFSLANWIARMYFCRYYRIRDPMNYKSTHNFVGEKHNIAIAKLMAVYLFQQIERLAREGALKVPPNERSSYRTSFKTGCSDRLARRIYDRIEAAKRDGLGTGKALMVLDMYTQSHERATAFMDAQGIKPKTKSLSRFYKHAQGVADGVAAGDRIGLDGQLGGHPSNNKMIR